MYDVAETLGLEVKWKVSRLDLFADFHGLGLASESRWDFVCRAKHRRTYEDGDSLETLYFGSGKPVLARLYDKPKEIEKSGSDWWPEVWGDAYRRGEQVWRVEFQIARGYLNDVGLSTPDEVLDASDRLWTKLSSEWLTLRIPTEDSNRSRWPLAAVWEAVQVAKMVGLAVGPELVRAGQRRGDLRKLTPAVVGHLAALGALIGAEDAEALVARLPMFLARDGARRGVRFQDRVADKRRAYELRQDVAR